jgi:hypothetical protein
MPAATALARAKRMLADARMADVKRGPNGVLVVADVLESPAPVTPGRYYMLDGAEMQLLVSRIAAAEASAQIARLMRNVRGKPRRE